jgi:hypothetical protein
VIHESYPHLLILFKRGSLDDTVEEDEEHTDYILPRNRSLPPRSWLVSQGLVTVSSSIVLACFARVSRGGRLCR